MKALVQDRYGAAEALVLRDVPRPTPGDGQVLVRVAAAGMDRGAWHFMTGKPYLMRVLGFGLRAPSVRIPGTNFAGVIERVGPGVIGFKIGDEVYGATRGTFADYAIAPVGKLALKPPHVSFEQAAVLPYPTFVAMQALRDHGAVRPGQRVLVVGASGAVGTITVQLAVALGASVTGVCSNRHAALVRSLGAEQVLDYDKDDLNQSTTKYDVIIDIGGRTSLARLRRALTHHGTLVIVGGEGGRWIGGIQRQLWAMLVTRFVPQTLVSFIVKERTDELLRLNDLLVAGQVAPVIGRTFALSEGAAAVAAFEAADATGRIVIAA